MRHVLLWSFMIIVTLLVALMFVPFSLVSSAVVSPGGGNPMNEFLVVKPDFGGAGYDQFFPQTITVNEGDQVNLTIRNLDNEGFQLIVENMTTVNITSGLTASDGSVTPVDTVAPVFTASAAGIFRFYAAGHQDMDGYLVVLPSNWANYNPPVRERKLHTLALPDFAGDGYDKFFPETLVVNQGDTVDISVRNTDEAPHGFGLPGYGIDVAVAPAQSLPNGTITPVSSDVPTFTAAMPGIFEFMCTVPCGAGHFEMTGVLVVLPKGNGAYSPVPVTAYRYLTVIPDFAGDGYDKYIPGTIFVDQGDLVMINIRNTDTMPHGFTITAFNINNETVAPATNSSATDTYITTFFASQPGIYEYFCTIPCGPGHDQMIGYLVVLPQSGAAARTATVTAIPSTGQVNLVTAVIVAFGMLFVGLVAGLAVTRKSGASKL
jgi:heme/copper-type cytochrome/quinol oxidase subunit 2